MAISSTPLGRSFVQVLIEADRVALLPQIDALFEDLKNDADGVAKARIDSAFPLDDAELAELKAALEKRFGKRIEATVNVDPALRRRRADHRRRHGDRRHGAGAVAAMANQLRG